MKYIFSLLLIVSCSSSPKKVVKTPETITNDDFKKDRALTKNEVSDFYDLRVSSQTPVLQDETIDNFSKKELSNINASADPLLDISLRCQRRDFDGAFYVANQNFNKYQKIASYWNLLGKCHLEQGSDRKALLFFNKAMEVEKNYIPALNNIGVMYSRQGQDQKALVAFDRASKLGKFSKTPRYNMAKLYLSYGLVDNALPVLQGLLRDAPQDIDLLNSIATAYVLLSDYNKALGFYRQIPGAEWKRPEIGLNLAVALMKSGSGGDAKKVFSNVSKSSNAKLQNYHSVIKTKLGEI